MSLWRTKENTTKKKQVKDRIQSQNTAGVVHKDIQYQITALKIVHKF